MKLWVRALWKHRIAYLFISPFFIIYGVFMGFPAVFSFYLSFTAWNGNPHQPMQWVGLANYRELFSDPIFFTAVKMMALYVPLAVCLGTAGALLLAILLNSELRLRGLFRLTFFLPTLTSGVVAAIVFRQLFSLFFPGLTWTAAFIPALLSIVVMTLWVSVGYNAILYLAGLQGIPSALYEAAELDGASAWQKFRYITLPGLRPTTFFIVTMGIIYGLQAFEPMQLLTRGGPENQTVSFVLYLYDNAFRYFRWGYASALAYSLFFIIIVFTALYFFISGRFGRSLTQEQP